MWAEKLIIMQEASGSSRATNGARRMLESVMVDNDFQTWHLIDWQHSR